MVRRQSDRQTNLNPDGATHSGNSSGSEGTSHTSSATGEGHGSMGSAIAGAAMGYMIARTMGSFLGPSYNPSNRAVSTPTGQVIQPQTNRSVGKPVLVKAMLVALTANQFHAVALKAQIQAVTVAQAVKYETNHNAFLLALIWYNNY